MNSGDNISIPLNSPLSPPTLRQLEAIKHTRAPHLIFAGAGKTTTITAKTAHMIEKEVINPSNPPENLKYFCSYK